MGKFEIGHKKSRGGRRAGAGRKLSDKSKLAQMVHEQLEINAEKALWFIVGVMDNPKASWGIRLAAAQDIVDRRYGKAKQAITLLGDTAVPVNKITITMLGPGEKTDG